MTRIGTSRRLYGRRRLARRTAESIEALEAAVIPTTQSTDEIPFDEVPIIFEDEQGDLNPEFSLEDSTVNVSSPTYPPWYSGC